MEKIARCAREIANAEKIRIGTEQAPAGVGKVEINAVRQPGWPPMPVEACSSGPGNARLANKSWQ